MTALPDIRPHRRAACRQRDGGLRAWLTLYFTDELGRPLRISRGQRALVDDLERVLRRDPGDAIRGLAAMCQRGGGKSTVMKATIMYALVVMSFRYAAILAAGTVYTQFSRDIRAVLRGEGPLVREEGVALLVADWDLRPSSDHPDTNERLWQEKNFRFYVGGWERERQRRISVRGMAGGNGDVRGLVDGVDRPDLLWADDPMKDIEAANMDVTTRVKTFVRTAYWPCGGPDARYVTTGTPFNDRDLITEQVTSPGEWPSLLRRFLPAVHPVNGALYMPHYWTQAKLDERRELIGSRAYAEQYLLDPQGGGVRIFEPAWLERWLTAAADVPPRMEGTERRARRVMFTDPSLGRTSKSDTSAITTLDYDGRTATGYVQECLVARRRPQDIVEAHLKAWQRWQPDGHAIEDEGAQEMLIPVFEHRVKELGLPPAAIPDLQRTRGVAKVIRIKRLSPLAEFGRLRFVAEGDHRECRNQMKSYQGLLVGNELDDGPDSVEGALRYAAEGLDMGATY